MSSREYAIALQWVQRKYAELYRLAADVVLVPDRYFPLGQLGQCTGDNYVSVSDAPATVGQYIDTLVHELTHCRQNAARVNWSKKQREEEAYAAGIQAAKEYMREAAPWALGKGVSK